MSIGINLHGITLSIGLTGRNDSGKILLLSMTRKVSSAISKDGLLEVGVFKTIRVSLPISWLQ